MNAKSFHLTAQGASHIKKNKECQDASSSCQDENCTIAIVCDGHGGDDYVRSAIGSKIGCAVAEKNIKKFFSDMDKDTFLSDPDKYLKNLEASIINEWNESIAAYHSANPFLESELSVVSERARKKYSDDGKIWSAYGTTMIAVAMNKDYWFGIHIGDGKCVAVNPAGEFKQPIPWDPKCFLNATTSICDSDAIERFRHFYSEKLPAAVFVGSDGIDDCFTNNEQLHNLYKTVLYSFATTDFDKACEGLADYLPRLSAKGSGDDVSIAALLDLDLIPDLSIVKEYDREKEKARVEENARKEAEKNEAEKRRVEEEHLRFQQQNNAKTKKPYQVKLPKFCDNCGERIRPGVKFCSNCGSKIYYAEESEEQQEMQVIKIAPFFSERDMESVDQSEEEIFAEDAVVPVDTEEEKTEAAEKVQEDTDFSEEEETVSAYETTENEEISYLNEENENDVHLDNEAAEEIEEDLNAENSSDDMELSENEEEAESESEIKQKADVEKRRKFGLRKMREKKRKKQSDKF